MPVVGDQFVADAEHQRHVGGGVDRNPFAAIFTKEFRGFRPGRIDGNNFRAAVFERLQIEASLTVGSRPGNLRAVVNIGAPHHHHFTFFDHHFPAGGLLINFQRAKHVRHDDLRRAGGIIAQMADIAAGQTQEALHQRIGFMENAGRTPAVRTGKNAFAAVSIAHAAELLLNDFVGFFPGNGHEFIAAAFAVGLGGVFQIVEETFADHRLFYTCFVVHLIGDHHLQRVIAQIVYRRAGRENFAVFDDHGQWPPVRCRDHGDAIAGRLGKGAYRCQWR